MKPNTLYFWAANGRESLANEEYMGLFYSPGSAISFLEASFEEPPRVSLFALTESNGTLTCNPVSVATAS